MDSLEQTLKTKLVEVLELDMQPEELDDKQQLFGDKGLGLDSVDVLEVVALLQMDYNLEIKDREQAVKVLANVASIAAFIRENA
jgi:acyl carrier protein